MGGLFDPQWVESMLANGEDRFARFAGPFGVLQPLATEDYTGKLAHRLDFSPVTESFVLLQSVAEAALPVGNRKCVQEEN